MSKLQQSTFFHAAIDSSEQTGMLINASTVNLDQELHCKYTLNYYKPFFKFFFSENFGIVNLEQEIHSW